MRHIFKGVDIKNYKYYFFDDMINIKNLDPDKVKVGEKSYKNISIFYIGCVTLKGLRYVKINRIHPLYFIINKINRYFEEIIGNKYLTLVPTDESKDTFKSMKSYGTK